MTKNIIVLLFSFFPIACNISAGTLGGFEIWYFPVSREIIEIEMDSIYVKYPKYIIPKKWEYLDDWSRTGYDFLKGRVFYFKDKPEEMYYVSFIEAGTGAKKPDDARISIRAVNEGESIWQTEEYFSEREKYRIQQRFYKEIILKIEIGSKTKATLQEKKWYE